MQSIPMYFELMRLWGQDNLKKVRLGLEGYDSQCGPFGRVKGG